MGDIIKSKILFTLSILFVLISLTCVCAADNQTDSIAVIETDSDFDGMLKESIDDNSSNLDDELKVANDEDKLTESISLFYFNSLYKKNDYKLDYDFEGSTQSKYGIEIPESDITIDGQGHYIKGDGKSRILMITGTNVVLKNIIFINGASGSLDSNFGFGYGGAVYFKNGGSVVNCTFINNTAPDGGAVCFYQCQGTVTDCHFINNTAEMFAGAVYLTSGSINNCDFNDNHASSYGGAAYIGYGGSITNSRFINNSVESSSPVCNGGAVSCSNGVTIDNCEFMNNSAKNGGAVSFEQSGTVSNSIFRLNNANQGAAIFSSNNLETDNCTFHDNRFDNVVSTTLSSSGTNTYLPYTVNLDLISVTEKVACGETVRIIANASSLGRLLNEGTVTISIGNKTYFGNVANGKATIELPGLNAGSYTENITYNGGDNYTAPSKTVMFNISKKPVSIYTKVTNGTQGGEINIHVTINGEGPTLITTGEITIYLDNVPYDFVTNIKGEYDFQLENIKAGEHVANITYEGGVNYTNAYKEIEFRIYKVASNMIISNISNCTYGENVAINIELSGNNMSIDEGNVYIKIGNQTYSADVNDGKATLTLSNLNAGVYTANVIFSSNNFNNSTQEVTFEVFKSNAQMNATAVNCVYGDSVSINLTLSGNNMSIDEGNVYIKIGDKTYSAKVNDGKATITLPNLNAGVYTENVTFSSDNYNSTHEVSFEVFKAKAQMDAKTENCNYGENITINIDLTKNNPLINNGDAYITIGDKTYSAKVNDGKATITLPNLNAGVYTENVTFSSDNYNSTQEVSFEVFKSNAQMEVTAENCNYAENVTINIDLTGNNQLIDNGDAYITIGDKTYSAKVNDGKATITLPNLNAGVYTENVTFSSDNYNSTQEVSFEVFKSNAQMEVTAENYNYSENIVVNINLTGNGMSTDKGNVQIKIGNKTYSAKVSNGKATIMIPNLNAGVYTGNVTFSSANFNNSTQEVSFEVFKSNVEIDAKTENCYYGEDVIIKVFVSDQNTVNDGTITLKTGNKNYTEKLTSQGFAIFTLSNMAVGTYDASISYDGDLNHNNRTTNITFDVLKQDASITAGASAYVINYGGKYSITLKDAKGNVLSGEKITFTLNGRNVGSAATNSNGVAIIALNANVLKAVKAGNKNLILTLSSDNYQASKTVKITVNKEKTKITAKKKTFKKSQKIKKYAVTLKNSKGKAVNNVKVFLKVKGKTFTAKTNSKGKATFKIKKLTKKGTYNAKITFKGNAYYLKTAKNVKIKLK